MGTAKRGRLARWLLETLDQAYKSSETQDLATVAKCKDVVGFVLEAADDTEMFDYRARLRQGVSLTTVIKELRGVLRVIAHFPEATIQI